MGLNEVVNMSSESAVAQSYVFFLGSKARDYRGGFSQNYDY
jgi:hypothetical protein